MNSKLQKILKIIGIIVGSIIAAPIALFLLFWIFYSVKAPIGIPDSVETLDYPKGFWVPSPPDQFITYHDFNRLKELGVNTLSIGPFVPMRALSTVNRPFIAQFVKRAHREDLAIHLAPVCWGPGFDGADPEMKDQLIREAIYWAKFAEKYNVEYFSPTNEGDVALGFETHAKWAQEILPQIREVYSGEIILKMGLSFTDNEESEYLVIAESMGQPNNPEFFHIDYPDMSGYDYLMVDIFPPDQIPQPEYFADDLAEIIQTAVDEAEAQGLKGVMIGEFGYPLEKPGYVESIMPGPVVTPEVQAEKIDEYLETAMPLVDGIFYCGWTLEGYRIKDNPAEDVIKKHFTRQDYN